MFVGGVVCIALYVYVRALHFLFPAALSEALQHVYFRGTTLPVSSSAVTDTRTMYQDCGNGSDFCLNVHDVWYVQG